MAKKFSDLPTVAQALILIVGALFLAGLVFYFYVWPLSGQRDNLKTTVEKLRAENRRNQAFEQERTEYLNRIAQLEKQLETLRSIVPDEPATDEFITAVLDAAKATNVNVRTLVAQPIVVRDFYTEMPFQVRLDATYYTMVDFFARLARAQRIVSVTNIALGMPQGGGMGAYTISPGETVGANVVMLTYFNRPEPATPAVPAKAR